MNGADTLKKANLPENPREVLIDIIESNEGLGKEDLFEMFRKEVIKSQGLTRAVQWYFFVNMYEYARTGRHDNSGSNVRSGKRLTRRLERLATQDAMVASIKQQLALLDLVMPNEKLMRDCTGAEMERFGTRFQRIAQKVGKANTVGDTLTEEQVRSILQPETSNFA